MKTLVLGLESADSDMLFGLDDLPFLGRLMEVGCYGRLESVVPPASIPAWMCLATSQDPGSLGISGSRSRVDHSYDGPGTASSTSVTGQTIWDHLHHGFWRNHDLAHDEHGAGSLYLETVRNYYRHLDDEIGKVLELLRDETVVLVVSPHRPQCPDAALHVTDRDDRSELGAFILAGPIRTLGGEVRGARLLDIAPTLLDLGGHQIPQSMQGRSLVELDAHESPGGGRPDADQEQIVRERLSGLGYI